jgi:hypothetical protein
MINMELRKSGKEMQKKKYKVEPKKWFYKCLASADSPCPVQFGEVGISSRIHFGE